MSSLMIVVGKYHDFPVFVNAPFWVWLALLSLTTTAYLSIAFFCVTIAETKAHGFAVNFTMILCSMLINMVLSDPTTLRYIFFNLDLPRWYKNITYLFYFVPCFQFGKMFIDIVLVACTIFSVDTFNWVPPERPFEYQDIWKVEEGELVTMEKYRIPHMVDTSKTLVYITIFYSILAWYCDNVRPSNRGIAQPKYFFLTLSYWFPAYFK